MRRMTIALMAPLGVALCGGSAGAQSVPLTVEAADITSEFLWGYRAGIKQPVGSVNHRRAVHQVSHRTDGTLGSPDYLVWIDDREATAEFIEAPVGRFDGAVLNPGGMAVFQSFPPDPSEEDRLWFIYGARANDLPFSLFRSASARDPWSWEPALEAFISDQGSTAPCIHALGDELFHVYRNGASSWARTTVRTQRFRTDVFPPTLVAQLDTATGMSHPDWGIIGIEQLWTRYDPRFDAIVLTWQWFRTDEHRFGSNPLLLSFDRGGTWRAVDGSTSALPLTYADMTPAHMPHDHLSTGEHTGWHVRDIGLAPDGTPWMTLPEGDAAVSDGWSLNFWWWDGAAWQRHAIPDGMHGEAKPHACGSTRDYMALVYSHEHARELLFLKLSRDSGRTWEGPFQIDAMPRGPQGQTRTVSWVSWFQPAERYADNTARFLIGYYRDDDSLGKNYRNRLRYVRVDIGPRSDRNADGQVDTTDFLAYLNAFAGGSPEGDFDDDGKTDTLDLLDYLNTWAAESD